MKPGDKVVWDGRGDNPTGMPRPFKDILIVRGKCDCGCSNGALMFDNVDVAILPEYLIPVDHWKQAEYMVEELKEELEVTV